MGNLFPRPVENGQILHFFQKYHLCWEAGESGVESQLITPSLQTKIIIIYFIKIILLMFAP